MREAPQPAQQTGGQMGLDAASPGEVGVLLTVPPERLAGLLYALKRQGITVKTTDPAGGPAGSSLEAGEGT